MGLSRKVLLLSSLYFSQGLPFGFFMQTLPVLLRKNGVSLELIGLTSILAAPWGLKFLWAPWIDASGSQRFGRRRSFIVPLQLAGLALMLVVSTLDPGRELWWVLSAIFAANLIAATQDIATDALAVDLLSVAERGLGNGVQVAAYRVGMVIGGGALLAVIDGVGWSWTFVIIAALLALATLPIVFHRESKPAGPRVSKTANAPVPREAAARVSFGAIWAWLRRPGMRAWAFVLVTYKAGDALGSSMVRPMLVDRGLSLSELGVLLGTVGFASGMVGALLGGWLLRFMTRARALVWFGAAHGMSLLLYSVRSTPFLYVASALEHLLGGMATAVLFTCMMDRVASETAATDYTVQASLVVGSGLFALASGLLANQVGYAVHFVTAAVLAWCGAFWAGRIAASRG